MSTQPAPAVPPRPARSPQPPKAIDNMPKIPPRPTNRRADRSMSPMRDSYAPSPLNEWSGPSMSRTTSNDLPQRPPSVTIPSLGEEGIEYADLDVGNVSDGHHQAPTETRNISSDLKIHAPRPSLPTSSAKAKVQAVTRTDSRQAAAAGLGREASPAHEEQERSSRSLQPQTSGSRAESSTASSDRRHSAQLADEHGFRVPMYPNAGDVQAPSPSPYLDPGAQRQGRHHNRSRSGRDLSLPPGSYGLHGHGVQNTDKFEKAWYDKHPDEYVKEEGQYGPGVGTPRPDWALSSDDLNKIVRGSAASGMGTSPAVTGTPEEEVGFLASDEYMHRMTSPPPDARHDTQPAVESPLRQMSFPATETEPKGFIGTPLRHTRTNSHSQLAEGGVIHVEDPMHPLHHPDGFAPTPALEDHIPDIEEPAEEEPILAADEIRPESAYLHPAVSPTFEHRGSFDEERSRPSSVAHSRSNSRSASAQGAPALTRLDSRDLIHDDNHTPLEDVEEYEPLFPEEKKDRPVSNADRFKKRPDTLKHRFPSEDIWEDTPNSLQLHATVTTPDLPRSDSSETFETPEKEAARKMQTSKIDTHEVAKHILQGEEPRDQEKPPKRPEAFKQRFPSRDIWEDAPDSQQLVTTVEPAPEEAKSPEMPSKPSIPPRPPKQAQSTSPTEKRQPPVIPDRPKPQVPARPAKTSSQVSADKVPSGEPTSKEDSSETPAVPKAKPAVPARPGGSKIAALKAGFLTDLNSRLQLGPQQPKEAEADLPAEKKPLNDARKGRARGPARRKPALEKPTTKLPAVSEVRITEAWNVWEITQDGDLVVGTDKQAAIPSTNLPEPSLPSQPPMAPALAKNTAGEAVEPTPESPGAADVVSPGTIAGPEADPMEAQTLPEVPTSEEVPIPTSEEVPIPTSEEVPTLEESTPANTEALSQQKELKEASEDSPKGAQPLTEPPNSKLDDAIENLAAVADGKRASGGEIHRVE